MGCLLSRNSSKADPKLRDGIGSLPTGMNDLQRQQPAIMSLASSLEGELAFDRNSLEESRTSPSWKCKRTKGNRKRNKKSKSQKETLPTAAIARSEPSQVGFRVLRVLAWRAPASARPRCLSARIGTIKQVEPATIINNCNNFSETQSCNSDNNPDGPPNEQANDGIDCELRSRPKIGLIIMSTEANLKAQSDQASGPRHLNTPSVAGLEKGLSKSERRDSKDEAILFTSIHQLCNEIVSQRLLARLDVGDVLCLFVFGRPGSSKGELSFELVEHCSLAERLNGNCQRENCHHQLLQTNQVPPGAGTEVEEESEKSDNCPLYHFLDVSALIVTNIDERIREFNWLSTQALRVKHQQNQFSANLEDERLLSVECTPLAGTDELRDIDSIDEDDTLSQSSTMVGERESETTTESEEQPAKETSESLAESTPDLQAHPTCLTEKTGRQEEDRRAVSSCGPNKSHLSDHFGLCTLSTRQRSILQLKLVKYSTCVTAKWVRQLIEREVERLEAQLEASVSSTSRAECKMPKRVYLINLIPNQLSLFKTCLYLQQNLQLDSKNFARPFWGLSFERRTNIRLLVRGRAGDHELKGNSSKEGNELASESQLSGLKEHFKRLYQIKLSTLLTNNRPIVDLLRNERPKSAPSSPDNEASKGKCSTLEQDEASCECAEANLKRKQQVGLALATSATSLIANSANEKLGPKFNDHFAMQFKAMNRFIQVRYNQTTNYNYASARLAMSPENSCRPEELVGGEIRDNFNRGCEILQNRCPLESGQSEIHKLPCETQTNARQASGQKQPDQISQSSPQRLKETGVRCQSLVSATPSPCNSSSSSIDNGESSRVPRLRHHSLSASPNSLVSLKFSSPVAAVPLTAHHLHGHHKLGCVLKWAVELELVNGQTGSGCMNKWYSSMSPPICSLSKNEQPLASGESSPVQDDRHHNHKSTTDSLLHVYKPPSDLSSPLTISRGQPTTCSSDHYHLVATQVAYANCQNASVFEVKRLHRRPFSYIQARSDAPKLVRLASKVARKLCADLDVWLKAAIQAAEVAAPIPVHLVPIGGHRSPPPLLVVCTIRVDIARWTPQQEAARHVKRKSNTAPPIAGRVNLDGISFDKPLHDNLTAEELTKLLSLRPERPALSKRPASALANLTDIKQQGLRQPMARATSALSLTPPSPSWSMSSSASSPRPSKRHVQFKLSQPPAEKRHTNGCEADADNANSHCAQKRAWLHESLFVSCGEPELLLTFDAFAGEVLEDIQKRSIKVSDKL